MRLILLTDVRKVGKKDDIIEVSDGYANNYLIKNKLAVPYTKRSKEVLDISLDKRKKEEEEKIAECNAIKNKLENKTFKFEVKTGTQDKVFGKISTKQIADLLKKNGYNIDKKCIILDHDISSLGLHDVLISLHKEVKFKIKISLNKVM